MSNLNQSQQIFQQASKVDKQLLSDAKADPTSPTPCGNDLLLPYPLNENKKYKPSYQSFYNGFPQIFSVGPQWVIQLN